MKLDDDTSRLKRKWAPRALQSTSEIFPTTPGKNLGHSQLADQGVTQQKIRKIPEATPSFLNGMADFYRKNEILETLVKFILDETFDENSESRQIHDVSVILNTRNIAIGFLCSLRNAV